MLCPGAAPDSARGRGHSLPRPHNLLVRDGILVPEDAEPYAADLAIRDGRIAGIFAPGEAPPSDEVLEAGGLHVLPGVVDAHVHVNEPGRTHWEGYETGSAAAAVGGVTCFL